MVSADCTSGCHIRGNRGEAHYDIMWLIVVFGARDYRGLIDSKWWVDDNVELSKIWSSEHHKKILLSTGHHHVCK